MGMSADLEAAVAEGATIVRVGTALFGGRASRARLPDAAIGRTGTTHGAVPSAGGGRGDAPTPGPDLSRLHGSPNEKQVFFEYRPRRVPCCCAGWSRLRRPAPAESSAARARATRRRSPCARAAARTRIWHLHARSRRRAGGGQRGGLGDGTAPYAANQTVRCDPLPADQRQDCIARMQVKAPRAAASPVAASIVTRDARGGRTCRCSAVEPTRAAPARRADRGSGDARRSGSARTDRVASDVRRGRARSGGRRHGASSASSARPQPANTISRGPGSSESDRRG